MNTMSQRLHRRQKILLAALRVFARRGFQRATLREVAQEAGIGKSTIYEYFHSKTHLFQELVEFLFRHLEKASYGAVDPNLPVPEQLCQILHSFADALVQAPFGSPEETLAITTDIFAESIRHGTVDLRPIYERDRTTLAALLQKGLRNGEICTPLAPETLASLIVATLDGLLTQWLLWPEETNLHQQVEAFCRLLRDALRCPGE